MDWGKTIQKGILGALTFGAAYLAANPQVLTHLIPSNIEQMTVGSLAAMLIVAGTNWIKNFSAKK